VLNQDPDISAAPVRVHKLLRWCLEKDRKQRLQAIGDARRLLAEDNASVPIEKRPSKLPWAAAMLAIVAIVASLAAWAPWRKPLSARDLVQFQIPTPERPPTAYLYISPDGRHMVYGGVAPDGGLRMWLRSLDSLDARVLPGTDGAGNAFWSADSRFVGFSANGMLKKIPIARPRVYSAFQPPGGLGLMSRCQTSHDRRTFTRGRCFCRTANTFCMYVQGKMTKPAACMWGQ
jgi:hypothetical protein